MTAALRRGVGSALTEIRGGNAFLKRCSFSSSSAPRSISKCASAAQQVLLADDAADASPPKVEMAPFVLQRRVVVYDGVCHLCHSGVKWIIRADKDRKIKFCCLQSKAAEPYMKVCGVDREDVLRRFLFIEDLGLYHQGSAAALKVLSYLPLPYSALNTLMIVPTPLRDAVYDYVAKRRYDWFGKDDDCIVMKEVELLERFVDWEELLERSHSQQP